MAYSKQVAALLKDTDPEELRTMASHMESLSVHPGWNALHDLLLEARENAMTRLITSQATESAAMYAKSLGFLNGVLLAPDAVETVLALAKKAEQEAERIAAAMDKE